MTATWTELAPGFIRKCRTTLADIPARMAGRSSQDDLVELAMSTGAVAGEFKRECISKDHGIGTETGGVAAPEDEVRNDCRNSSFKLSRRWNRASASCGRPVDAMEKKFRCRTLAAHLFRHFCP